MSEFGEIHPPRTMFFRETVGEISDDEGNKYECTTNVGGVHPIIQSKQTGKWFTLSWADIVSLAIEAGIDKKDKVKVKSKAVKREKR